MSRAKKAPPVADAVGETITGYKGFGLDWKCRGYQYAVGRTEEHEGKVAACEGGLHSCEDALDVLTYYPPSTSRYAVVEQSGDLARHNEDSKVASRKLTVKAEIDIAGLVKASIDWRTKRCEPVKTEHATGYRAASSATGDRAASSATGDRAASSATGYRAASSATGDSAASSATGYSAASSATGYRAASSATGYSAASSATGDSAASSATGYSAASSATGDSAASLTTGPYSSSAILPDKTPQHAVAVALGHQSKAKAPAGSAIVCVYRNGNGELVHIRAAKVGDGIKPDTWYSLDASGNFVEVQP